MTKIDVGQGAVLGSWAENAVRWERNADDRDEVSKQDDPKDEKFKGVPPIHASEGSLKRCKFLLIRTDDKGGVVQPSRGWFATLVFGREKTPTTANPSPTSKKPTPPQR
jgi:hypothetical protein